MSVIGASLVFGKMPSSFEELFFVALISKCYNSSLEFIVSLTLAYIDECKNGFADKANQAKPSH
jgi:hypothetical protein